MPVAATRHDAAGAKAFAEFFIKTVDWGFATLGGAYIRHFARNSCIGCRSFADGMDEDRRLGHRYFGGRITVKMVQLQSIGAGGSVIVVVADQQSYEKTDARGKLLSGDQARVGLKFQVTLEWASSWLVARLAVVSS